MRTPVFLSSLHMNCTVHSFMLTNVMKEKQKGGRIKKKKTGPIKLYTCVMLGEKKNPQKMSSAAQNTFELPMKIKYKNKSI